MTPTNAATAAVDVEVKPHVGIGLSTAAGGTVTIAAFLAAIVAFAQGARDEATLSALAVGTIALVTTMAGRAAQAVAAIKTVTPAPPEPVNAEPAELVTEVRDYGAAEHAAQAATAAHQAAEQANDLLGQVIGLLMEGKTTDDEGPAALPADAGIGEPADVAADLEPAAGIPAGPAADGPDDPGDLPLKPDVDLDDVADRHDAVRPGDRAADLGGDLCHPGEDRIRAEQTDDDR